MGLAILAFGAALVVRSLKRGRRRLVAELRRYADEEAALADVARALSGTQQRGEVLEHIVEGAVTITRAFGAYIERAHGTEDVEVLATAGRGVPPVGTRAPYPGSVTEEILGASDPTVIHEIDQIGEAMAPYLHERCRSCTGLVVPMLSGDELLGALVLLRSPKQRSFQPPEAQRARTLGDLGTVALQRIAAQEQTERKHAELIGREREARAEAERRMREEIALREAIEAVTATFTVEGVIQQIAESAAAATNSIGSIVERIDIESEEVAVVSGTGVTTPLISTRLPYEGSLAAYVIERGREEVVLDLSRPGHPVPDHILEQFDTGSALIAPLLDAGAAIGALFLIRGPNQAPYRPDEAARARTFANLAALAFRKVHLLEDSERRREELERVMESRSRLMRGFSHDVKNPLGAADGHAQLLQDGVIGELEPNQQESIERIRGSIRTALDLIDDLLDLARAETGQIGLRSQPADLREIARELGGTYRSQAEAAGIELHIDYPRQFPVIKSDIARIRQILGNLLSNAVKFSSIGDRIDIIVRHHSEGAAPGPGEWLSLTVADTGSGIPEEEMSRLFEEFARLDEEGTSGSGLGLAISRGIARLLGGDITAESEIGRGSRFVLWLPAARDDD